MERQRDLLFEAVMTVAGWNADDLTQSARGRTNRALVELREVGATPEEVLIRGRRYWEKYKDLSTARPAPWTLAAHWPGLGVPTHEHVWRRIDDVGQFCAECGTTEYQGLRAV